MRFRGRLSDVRLSALYLCFSTPSNYRVIETVRVVLVAVDHHTLPKSALHYNEAQRRRTKDQGKITREKTILPLLLARRIHVQPPRPILQVHTAVQNLDSHALRGHTTARNDGINNCQ